MDEATYLASLAARYPFYRIDLQANATVLESGTWQTIPYEIKSIKVFVPVGGNDVFGDKAEAEFSLEYYVTHPGLANEAANDIPRNELEGTYLLNLQKRIDDLVDQPAQGPRPMSYGYLDPASIKYVEFDTNASNPTGQPPTYVPVTDNVSIPYFTKSIELRIQKKSGESTEVFQYKVSNPNDPKSQYIEKKSGVPELFEREIQKFIEDAVTGIPNLQTYNIDQFEDQDYAFVKAVVGTSSPWQEKEYVVKRSGATFVKEEVTRL